MEKKVDPKLFVNDGSFMEKFKQMQQEMQKKEASAIPKLATSSPVSGVVKPSFPGSKAMRDSTRATESPKTVGSSSTGKLAFSLKQKSKVSATSIKLGADEEEEEEERNTKDNLFDASAKRKKLGQPEAFESTVPRVVAPSPPSDPSVKKVADRLASFVAKNGRQFEHVTRQRNPGDTPFKFLFDSSCSDYKYYEYRLSEEEKCLSLSKDTQSSSNVTPNGSSQTASSSYRPTLQHSNYHTPASALYDSSGGGRASTSAGTTSVGNNTFHGETGAPSGANPIEMMEYYMKKAAQEERKRPPKQSKDEMPPPASLQVSAKKGHHMGDYIPQEELDKFLASCNDAASQKAAREAAENAKIQADNVGHKLLSKMGWKEGEGLGSSKSGRADPVMAGNVKLNNLGVGAEHPGEVSAEDDIYEQYKKRMMLGYRHRPNPLNNPRKAYY